ncbi:type IV pili methyl-accepting chemotaxis transducer N-terminal domain-containing protein [Paraburkholderia kirstenboschensis]|uniref:Type IV pili methyl-accepting chemotaxis transducer N-terminal domain-containing protein n=1 Tax=Paraburkholderia kirstenboschensis TaxID=1245436 RepID=A0ABZ0ESC5_9BURK|nr:type IV pili methyl-accepting chemotaxis transducer N-terminal domain-containing protein [Paraburkholderia kirstenboschensis]WOD20050.1 type IV pili methyl-accepting chemotaxis transducer N-terminal domain-containing protein [Paraburkholderia kirstenboschensis]
MLTTIERLQGARSDPAQADVSSEVLSSLINIAGRQRMLSQRIVFKAMLALRQSAGALAIAQETLRTFADSHAALVQGRDGLPGLFSPALREAFHGNGSGSGHVAKKIKDFIALACAALDAIAHDSASAESAVEALVASADPLLSDLHGVTAVYEEESRRIARAQKKEQQHLNERIKSLAREAHIVSFNGQIVASRTDVTGREFAVVAGVMTSITKELEAVVSAFVKKTSGA